MRIFAVLAVLFPTLAWAAGQLPAPQLNNPTVTGGSLSGTVVTGATVVPTSNASETLATLAAQQGVLLDSFKQAGDVDDTASLNRAKTAGVPILLGPRTYTINNFSTGSSVTSFILKGVAGASVIQRTTATGSGFFSSTAAYVSIDGVTFDMNSANVTGTPQWGVFLNGGGQTVSVTHSVFKNNSGSLGSCFSLIGTGPAAGGSFTFTDNEVTNCSFNSAFFGSVSNGIVARNHIHDVSSYGIYVGAYGAASATNYAADILISDNRILRTSSVGVMVGGIGIPFIFGTPSATYVDVNNNFMQDNALYGISLEGDYCTATGNHINQSAPSVSVLGAIDTMMRWGRIQNNEITLNAAFAIDIGGSQNMLVSGNVVTQTQGVAYNTGGNLNSTIRDNVANLTNSAIGLTEFAIEGGGGGQFPTPASNTIIENNTFNMNSTTASGIEIFDDAGGSVGAMPLQVRGNKFNAVSGNGPADAITWWGGAHSVYMDKNIYNGGAIIFTDPNSSGDVIFDWVQLGTTIQGASPTMNIRSIVPRATNTYGGGGSVLWVKPTAGGSNYTAATVINFSGTGCTGQSASPQINSGVIIGVRMNTFGSGCSGTVTATASDTGGGTGATFALGTLPVMPDTATLQYVPAGAIYLLTSGGYIGINSRVPFLQESSGGYVNPFTLQVAYGGGTWQMTNYNPPYEPISSLPACTTAGNGATVNITNSVTGKWQARCNGTSWMWPDGTAVSN